MQVIVKNALEEDKRVARYPKHPSFKSSKRHKPFETSHQSNFSSSKPKKDFMQLVFDDSLVKEQSKLDNELKFNLPTSTSLKNDRPLSKVALNQANFDNGINSSLKKNNKQKIKGNKKSAHSSSNSSPIATYETDSHFLELNDLEVKNDPESFKRSIPHPKHKAEIKSASTEISPHPRGGPDSHDVFKFDFDNQFPSRPSFTFTEPTSFTRIDTPQNHHSTTFSKNTVSSHNINVLASSPNVKPPFQTSVKGNGNSQKTKHDNIVWNKFSRPNRPAKLASQRSKDRRKPIFTNKFSGLKSSLKGYRLPSSHPLRSIIPKTARVVGIQSIKRNKAWLQGVNRHDKPPHIMTVEDFLKMYPNMNSIRGAIPVPISEKKHIRMIELLAAQSKAKNGIRSGSDGFKNSFDGSLHNPKRQISQKSIFPTNNPPRKNREQLRTTSEFLPNKEANLDDMLKELDKLIKERAEKRVIHFRPMEHKSTSFKDNFVSTQENHIFHENKNHIKNDKNQGERFHSIPVTTVVPIRPRGEGPSVRFTSTTSKPPITVTTPFSFKEKDVTTSTVISPSLPSTTSLKPLITKNELELSPKLEFGFKPITTKSYFSFATSTTQKEKSLDSLAAPKVKQVQSVIRSPQSFASQLKSSDPFQTGFDTVNEIIEPNNVKFATRYPRLIPSDHNSIFGNSGKTKKHKNKSAFKNNVFKNSNDILKDNRLNVDNSFNSIISSDPFFFTTTTAKPILFSQSDVDSSFSTSGVGGISSTLFDMRKFFFIPKKSKSKQSKNVVSSSSSFQKSGQNRRIWRKPPRRTFFPRINL